MVNDNLWGSLDDIEIIRTPTTILHEQAEQLKKITGGILEGEINTRTIGSDRFIIDLNIVVPSMESYSYNVLQVRHGITIYPLIIAKTVDGKGYECANEEEFKGALKVIFSSKEMKTIITALLSLAKGT